MLKREKSKRENLTLWIVHSSGSQKISIPFRFISIFPRSDISSSRPTETRTTDTPCSKTRKSVGAADLNRVYRGPQAFRTRDKLQRVSSRPPISIYLSWITRGKSTTDTRPKFISMLFFDKRTLPHAFRIRRVSYCAHVTSRRRTERFRSIAARCNGESWKNVDIFLPFAFSPLFLFSFLFIPFVLFSFHHLPG